MYLMNSISKTVFYILSYTWGLPMTLVGHLVELVMFLFSHPSRRYVCCREIVVGHGWGGCTVGRTILRADDAESVLPHEHGHAVQNCFFGIFLPFIVCIPSASRYWYREFMKRTGKGGKLPPYDSIWFEGQATHLGRGFVSRVGKQ